MLTALAISNYRSLCNLVIPLKNLNVITGPNGSGKSSIYRALRLLAETAQGGCIPSLARESGLQSTLWAGPEELSRGVRRGDHPVEGTARKESVSLRLGFASNEFSYAIDFGLPTPSSSAFALNPVIKSESIRNGPVFRPATTLVDRHGSRVKVRGESGGWEVISHPLPTFDGMMTELADPKKTARKFSICDAKYIRGGFTITFGPMWTRPCANLKSVRIHQCWGMMALISQQLRKPSWKLVMAQHLRLPSTMRFLAPVFR